MLDQRFIKCLSEKVSELNVDNLVNIELLLDKLDSNEISINNDTRFDAIFKCEWADEFISVLNSVRNIISDPKIILRDDRVVVQADIANKVDVLGFQQTMREAKLWRNEPDKPRPNYIYNTFYEDEMRIRENLFVVAVVNKMLDINSRYLYYLNKNLANIREVLTNNSPNIYNLNFVNANIHEEFKGFKRVSDHLDAADSDIAISFRKLNRIRILLNHIRSSYFYKVCNSGAKYDLGNIIPTKILLDVKDYYAVFNFWNRYSRKNMRLEEFYYCEDTYHNYVFTKLVYSLNKISLYLKQESEPVSFIDGVLTAPKLAFYQSCLQITISSIGCSEIEINTELLGCKSTDYEGNSLDDARKGKYLIKCISTMENFLDLEEHQIRDSLNDTRKAYIKNGYTDCFVITTLGNINTDKNIIRLNSSDAKADALMGGLLDMITMLSHADGYVYSVRCPMCGSNVVERNIDSGDYLCGECLALWSVLIPETDSLDNLIYIKRI